MSKEIGGKFINLEVRRNGTADAFQVLVCAESSQFSITSESNTKRTNCGPKTSVTDPTAVASGTGVQNITPTSTELSYQDIVEIMAEGAKIDYRYYNEADTANSTAEGDAIEHIGSGYFTSLVYNAAADPNDGTTFDWEITTTGTLGEYDDES